MSADPKPTQAWLDWLASMKMPARLPGEGDGAWTDRIIRERAALGRNRQCSIGYHEECSSGFGINSSGDCECPCHGMDYQALVQACVELEADLAALRATS